jgi:arylsulfatase A-like enzyme
MKPRPHFSRRDFLKLASLIPAALSLAPLNRYASRGGTPGVGAAGQGKHLIVIVFDAWAAHDVSLYGFPRQTMPNLARFAERASVYHNHYSGGTFTIPGTASLLTGLYPWSHRAFQVGGQIINAHRDHHAFAVLGGGRYTLAYSQNPLADVIVSQTEKYIQRHLRPGSFSLDDNRLYSLPMFKGDRQVAATSMKNILDEGQGIDGSIFFGLFYRLWTLRKQLRDETANDQDYPRGLPSTTYAEVFTLQDAVDGAIAALKDLQEPTLAYLHFFPPHKPYKPTAEFARAFNDDWRPLKKPIHPLSSHMETGSAAINRQWYDQYLASWDAEAGRLLDHIQSTELADNSYVFITADHGEMFERGEVGHFTRLMFDPVMHIPLLARAPGQTARQDLYDYTSNVDILPTLALLAGVPGPSWAEGRPLPGFGGQSDAARSIFVMDAKGNPSFSPMQTASFSITRGDGNRLAYYRYPGVERYEMYNLSEDPEELTDLYPAAPAMASDLKSELLDRIAAADRPYRK